jgi:hypothetical protein
MLRRIPNVKPICALCVIALAALTTAAGCDDSPTPVCQDDTCSGHGACADEDGVAVCTCDEGFTGDDCSVEVEQVCDDGYQDNDDDGECLPDCDTADLDCEPPHVCDDSSGEAACECAEGYTGAECSECDDGYQDNDDDGECLPDCDTAELTCPPPNECDDSGGIASCECAPGYAGADCSLCDDGFQDNDDDGECEESCAASDLECGPRQHCEDGSGTATCIDGCAPGYTGDDCEDCADGFQDNDDDGSCLPDCDTAELTCPVNSACDDTDGAVVCACDDGYQDNDDNGSCTPDCATSGLVCDAGMSCDDVSGTPECVCAAGYQDNDGDSTCEEDCTTAALDCSGHGACDDSRGRAVCDCDVGWDRSDCSICDSPYYQAHLAEDGTLLSCETSCYLEGDAFPCGLNERCAQDNGVKECVCADGYQDNDGDGACLPTCATAQEDADPPLECPDPHGRCDDSSGTATCLCQTDYVDDPAVDGPDCLGCVDGLQDNDGDHTCRPDCATAVAAGLDCGAAGCTDASGVAGCICDEGTQDNDGNGVCLPDCAHSGLVCDPGSSCVDTSGEATCLCDPGLYPDSLGSCRAIGAESLGDTCDAPMELDPTVGRFYADFTLATPTFAFSCNAYGLPFNDLVYHAYIPAGVSYQVRIMVDAVDGLTELGGIPVVAGFVGPDCATAMEIGCGYGVNGDGAVVDAELQGVIDGGPTGLDTWLVVGMFDYFENGITTTGVTVDLTRLCNPGEVLDEATGACVDDPCDPNPCAGAHQGTCAPDLSGPEPGTTCACDIGYTTDDTGACVVDPAALGEGCGDVLPMPVVTEGMITGSTADAQDDGESWCSGYKVAKDRVYGFTLDREMRLSLTLTPVEPDPTYDALMHIRSACDDPGSQVMCYDIGPTGAAEHTSVDLDPGTYYLFVDGWNNRDDDAESDGTFELTYSFYPNPCPDDESVCPGEPVCHPVDDWSVGECVCETPGLSYFGGGCVADPCYPDACADVPHSHCVADLAAGTADCACNSVSIDDGATCSLDPEAEWTVMIYWAMDNNLAVQAAHEVTDAAAAALDEDVRVVGMVDFMGEPSSYYVEFSEGRQDRVAAPGDLDSGDWRTLRDFGVWAVENYPARHYALIISDHGGGWRSDATEVPPVLRAICWDDESATPETGIGITNGELSAALDGIVGSAGGPMDILVYDACVMGEWEMVDVSEPYADYMIASPSSIYGYQIEAGSYTAWLNELVEGAETMTALDAGEAFMDNYRTLAPGFEGTSVTGAMTDLATADELDDAVSGLADALMANESPELYATVDELRFSGQRYAATELVDLGDLARRLAEADVPEDVVVASEALTDQLEWSVVYDYADIENIDSDPFYGSVRMRGSTGLSIYLPDPFFSMDPLYRDYGAVWSDRATWDDFLVTFARGGRVCDDPSRAAISTMGTVVDATARIEQSGLDFAFVQSFLAPERELHGVRLAVRKTEPDAMPHDGFVVGVYVGDVYLYGWVNQVAPNDGEVQYICVDLGSYPVEPGTRCEIALAGGYVIAGYEGEPFATPIEWPIEYAASPEDPPPYADGEAFVRYNWEGYGMPIGEHNGDGIPGTFWFEVY